MPKEKTNKEKVEDIICKVGDIKVLWKRLAQSDDELLPVLNCFDRLLYDVLVDADNLLKTL